MVYLEVISSKLHEKFEIHANIIKCKFSQSLFWFESCWKKIRRNLKNREFWKVCHNFQGIGNFKFGKYVKNSNSNSLKLKISWIFIVYFKFQRIENFEFEKYV